MIKAAIAGAMACVVLFAGIGMVRLLKGKDGKKDSAPKAKKEKGIKTKVCPACQAEIPKKAKVCPNCNEKQKSGKKPILVLIPLLLVLLLVGAAVSIFVFHFPIDPPFELPFLGPKISETVLGEGMELTKKQEEEVLAVLNECGFGEISAVETIKETSKSTTYAVSDTSTERFLDTDDPIVVQMKNATKTIDSVQFQDHSIYAHGQVVSPITDYYLDMAERDIYLSLTLTAVKSRLEVPEAAVFPSKSSWEYTMGEGTQVTVRSTVTCRDASGKEEERAFVAHFEDGAFASLEFEGEEEED